MTFESVKTASGRTLLKCLDCGGFTRPDHQAAHECPRDATGQMWRREALKDPYREIFICPGCGDKTGILAGVFAHFCEGAEAVAGFKADLETAIEQARREGAREALLRAYEAAELEADEYGSAWGWKSAGHNALWRVAAAIDDMRKKELGQ